MTRRDLVLFVGLALACTEEGDVPVTTQRGAPKLSGGKAGAPGKAAGATRKPTAGAAGDEDEDELLPPPPERPLVTLDAESFTRRRDPFLGFSPTEIVVAEPDSPRASRTVEMRQYAYEDLKLIAIVNAGRGMRPRALFLASDGRSQAIEQGEYFSSAEVLLAAVNRDYVEIEVVDDDLAASLNLARGERRAIQLRNE